MMIVTVKTDQLDLQATEVAEALEHETGFEVTEVVVTDRGGTVLDQWWQGKVART